ncbi:MAG TPA: alanine racemase, partial [Thermomicrobiales bacterium]|nr:alanine racemase [Thermomicrobiales bacterium]
NLTDMAEYAKSCGITLRPHFKTHKTGKVAERQKALGSTGITVAKIGEAEALVDAGVYDDFFIANEIVGPIKHKRLLALMERAKVRVAVDTRDSARGLNDAMGAAGRTLDVVIELNTGQNRAGVYPNEALGLAETIRNEMPNLRVVGLMTHEGHAGATLAPDGIVSTAIAAGKSIIETAEQLREHGFDISVVSVGSTPAAKHTTTIEGITEMRPGTYVFNDNSGFRFGTKPEDCALRILATVTSRPAPDRAILDCGSKTLTSDKSVGREGYGYIVEYPDAEIISLSEEHGWLRLPESAQAMKVGDKVEVIPNHVCPAVNLQDEMYLIRNGEVAETWPVIARGRVR